MITLSRLNGMVVAINPDLITWIEVTPDTTVSLLCGDKIIVRESLDEVVSRVIEFRKAIGAGSTSYPPSTQVLQGAAWRRESATTERHSNRPSMPITVPPITFRK